MGLSACTVVGAATPGCGGAVDEPPPERAWREESPPGGVPLDDTTPPVPSLADRQANTLFELPGEVAEATGEFTLGTAEGAWHGTVGVGIEAALQLHDVAALTHWALTPHDDGRPVEWPVLYSSLVQGMERGVPSAFVDGKAGSFEHLARAIPVANLVFVPPAAIDAMTRGDARALGQLTGSTVVGVALGAKLSRRNVQVLASTPELARVAQATVQSEPVAHPISLRPATGPWHAPREMDLRVPRAPAPMDTIGQPPRTSALIAAIDDGMGGDDGVPPMAGPPRRVIWLGQSLAVLRAERLFGVDQPTAEIIAETLKNKRLGREPDAALPDSSGPFVHVDEFLLSEPEALQEAFGLSRDSLARDIAKAHRWTLERLDDATASYHPRLRGSWLQNPIIKNPVLDRVTQQMKAVQMSGQPMNATTLAPLDRFALRAVDSAVDPLKAHVNRLRASGLNMSAERMDDGRLLLMRRLKIEGSR
jgi:hypothetical protein